MVDSGIRTGLYFSSTTGLDLERKDTSNHEEIVYTHERIIGQHVIY